MKTSLAVKFGGLVIALVITGGAITAILVNKSASDALQKSLATNQVNTAEQTVDKIDRFLYERLVDVEQVTGRQQVQAYAETPSSRTAASKNELVKQLNNFDVLVGTWNSMSILDASGQLAVSTGQSKSAQELVNQPEFQKLLSAAKAGQAGYTDAFLYQANDAPVMVFMSPIRSSRAGDPSVVGVLAGELLWPSITEILQSVKGTVELVNASGTSLGDSEADQNGKADAPFTAHYQNAKAFQTAQKTQSGTAILPTLDDSEELSVTSFVKETGYLNYNGNKWYLFIESPRSDVFAPIYQLNKQLIITFAIILMISTSLLLIIFNHQVLRRIRLLQAGANRLARGDFSQLMAVKSGDEIGQLGISFNEMSAKLHLAYGSLRESIKDTQDEKLTLQKLLENLPVGVLVVRAPDGKPIMMNRAGEQISGRGVDSHISGKDYVAAYDVLKSDGSAYPVDDLPLNITLKTGKPAMKDDMVMRRPDGTTVEVRALTAPLMDSDGQVHRAVSVFEDISQERVLERSRDEFFSIASHELRTPLTAIRGNTSLIQQYFMDDLKDDNLKGMVDDIHESSIRLIEIVNDFLDTSRLEQNRMKYNLEVFDVVEMAEVVIREYSVTGSRQKIHLEVVKPEHHLPSIFADKNRTKQVLINLVGNALKFTDAGKVTISFEPSNDLVKVRVSDTGHGMTSEAQKLLFKKFEQTGDSPLTRDSVRGTGLGLYISKMMVEQMHGHIQLESSEEGKGSTFFFELPVAKDGDTPTAGEADIHTGKIKLN